MLTSKCVPCHGPDKGEGKLRLDSAEALAKGGVSGPAIDPGDPGESLLLKAVRHDDGVSAMPPKESLRDDQIADLAAWVRDGAAWPAPARVLVEDDPAIVPAFTTGDGSARLEGDDRAYGSAALVVSGQREVGRVAGWNFPVREHPGAGEVRYLRFSWKKRGGGAMMFELARDGTWRSQGETNASWVAGVNTTGWAAIPVAEDAPGVWMAVTRDLWADGGSWGDWSVTGLGVTAIDGGEVALDSVLLGPTIESLDAYKPGRGVPAFPSEKARRRLGDAWTDAENPIRTIFRGERLDLWSLRKPARPPLPEVRDPSNVRAPVDRFVLAKLDAEGLAPSPEADRRTLIRRVTFDVTGLPPTPDEVRAFVEDRRPDAYDRLVDRLLASPRYGEKWGRAWLDVVRYADSNGFERDEFRPNMWRYRDYVIRSLNADVPYDRFVTEQIAGDELSPGPVQSAADAGRIAATGYLRLGSFDSTTSLFTEDKKGRDELMADLANTTGRGLPRPHHVVLPVPRPQIRSPVPGRSFPPPRVLRRRHAEGRPGREPCRPNAPRSSRTTRRRTAGSRRSSPAATTWSSLAVASSWTRSTPPCPPKSEPFWRSPERSATRRPRRSSSRSAIGSRSRTRRPSPPCRRRSARGRGRWRRKRSRFGAAGVRPRWPG